MLNVLACQPWYLLHSSLRQQTCSPFLASNLGWCVKQDFLTLILSSSAAVYGSFEVVREGAISNESYSETSVRFLLCSKGSFYVFE